jgi:signal transduction histidine kinase
MRGFFQSMSGRVFLILVLGIVGSAGLTAWLAFGERQQTIGQFRAVRSVEQAEQFVLTLDAIPPAGRVAFSATARRFGLRVELGEELPAANVPRIPDARDATAFVVALREQLGAAYRLVSLYTQPSDCPPPRGRLNPPVADRPLCERVGVTLTDGSTVRMTVLPPRGATPPPRTDFLTWLTLFLLSIGVLAYFVARMTMRPLKQLAQAARDLGNDIDHPPLAEEGAGEIRQATAAFNSMQTRIRQHIQQRTQMLAAITHDLQTPLTRLRLRLEKVADPELRQKLIDDLSATQSMVREGLDLARSMDIAEPLQPLDLDSLLDSVCNDAADAGQKVTLQPEQSRMSVMARPIALRRCLTNLIDNACKYGGYAQVSVQRAMMNGHACARIRILDGGPGIAAEQMSRVFEPFYRVESSRSRNTGGTGLGLTIARNIAEQHGGSIVLANHPNGGLDVTLTLPEKSGLVQP